MTTTPTVQELRKMGAKVRVSHYRYLVNDKGYGVLEPRYLLKNHDVLKYVEANGGLTRVQVSLPDGNHTEGYAYCSFADSFNHKAGCKLALTRALKMAGLIEPEPPTLSEKFVNAIEAFCVRFHI